MGLEVGQRLWDADAAAQLRCQESAVDRFKDLPEAMEGKILSRLPDADAAAQLRCQESAVDRFKDLPEAMVGEILSRLPDARDLARTCVLSTSFRDGSELVKFVKFVCRKDRMEGANPGIPFRKEVRSMIRKLKCVERLRLEIDDGIQLNRYKKQEGEDYSLCLSDEKFVQDWLPPVMHTLRSLTVIDYGQEAIFHRTPLLQLLSGSKQLEFLELRNLFLDRANRACITAAREGKPVRLPNVTVLTLRCVKLTENGLKDINDCMPNLRTLTLVTVVGLKEARLTSARLEVLCLGLATKVKTVELDVECLTKLQLKMVCPEALTIRAPSLRCLAVCMDKRPEASVRFQGVSGLIELLMGSLEFSTLYSLCDSNPKLEKMFLDKPCMAFEDNGICKGVLEHVDHKNVPDMKSIGEQCKELQTLSVGPGLWYSFEQDMMRNIDVFSPMWPTSLSRLIIHIVVIEAVDVSLKLLTALVACLPSLEYLEVYVHADSKADHHQFDHLKDLFPKIQVVLDSWKKGLKFDRFNF